jgi:hypothetical protein
MFIPHPSSKLTATFAERPFQGALPHEAMFLFVGLDANYDERIEENPIFDQVLEYHRDGVAFWHRHLVHHPFLFPGYRGDGRRYHQSFARIGFQPEHASLVSFVELLHVPTVGRSALVPSDLSSAHLAWLNGAILGGRPKYTFISAGVARLMRASGAFSWLPREFPKSQVLPAIYSGAGRTVYYHLHFSNYGKFQAQLDAEADAIRRFLP